jgi:hypothetical protein
MLHYLIQVYLSIDKVPLGDHDLERICGKLGKKSWTQFDRSSLSKALGAWGNRI